MQRKMKRIFNYIMLAVVTVVATTACTPTVDDAFPESSSERIDAYSREVKEILQAAPNGWRTEYYASRTYGGYNVFCKFEGDSVTIASEKVGSSQNAGVDDNGNLILSKSHFKMEQSMGLIISFDTYNSVFHYFSEPKSDLGDTGDGMAGDFEFRVKSACKDSVVLEGKKHQSRVVMYPMDENTTWKEEYDAIQEVSKTMSARTYYVWKDEEDQNITVTTSYRRLVFEYIDDENQLTRESAAFIVTRDGYKFYTPIKVKGLAMAGFKIGEDGVYPEFVDHTLRLEAQTLPLYEQLTGSAWFITYDNLGDFAQPYWDTFHTALEKAGANESKATLYWAIIGYYSGKVGYHMMAGSDQATIGFTISQEDDEGKVVKMKYNASVSNKAGTNFYDKFKLKDALIPFIGRTKVSSCTFKLSVDNERRPTYMIMTDVNNPTNVIKLMAEEKYYPFGDEPDDE